jgi:16S rRNA processing protein RimM
MIKDNDIFPIGSVQKAYGTDGWLSIQISDDVFDRVDAPYLFCRLEGLPVPFFIEEYRFKSDMVVLMKFQDVDDQDSAHRLVGAEILFPHALSDGAEVASDNDWVELLGYQIIDEHEGPFGVIRNINDQTINTLFVVEATDGSELLIPAQEDLVLSIDTAQRELHVSLPAGLLSLH